MKISDKERYLRLVARNKSKISPQIVRYSQYDTDLIVSRKICNIFLDLLPQFDGYLGRECNNYRKNHYFTLK